MFRAARGSGRKGGIAIIRGGVSLALVLTSVSAGLVFIQPEERGVVISALQAQGYRSQVLTPGLRWIIPFAENVVLYRISKQTYTMSIASGEGQMPGDDSVTARTSDGQEVKIDASVIYSIDPNQVVSVHIAWQGRYTDELVRPQSRGIIRDQASQLGVEEIVSTQRDQLISGVRERLRTKLGENGLILEDFILRNITFSPEYAASVEQKQIAEQLAQQAKFVVEQRKQEAEQARQQAQGLADAVVIRAKADAEARVIQAEAEAEALGLIADQLRDNLELVTYRYVEKLSPGIQVMLVPSNNPFLLPLPELAPTAQPTPAPTPR
ncbi:MAG: prohibitin family protein [Chloroflexi bacterium]|nr:prohibitin family protein [Chloroflexota bacterium]